MFLLTTDEVHEHVDGACLRRAMHAQGDALDAAARELAQQALANGSPNNLTVQIVRIEALPTLTASELQPHTTFDTVRGIIQQIARGLQALHRLEMLHQDLRPQSVMIEARTGGVKTIDFGAVRVAGIEESFMPLGTNRATSAQPILGTAPCTTPEYFLGENGTPQSGLFSLGVIAYQMLCDRLLYETAVSNTRTRPAQRRLRYVTALADDRDLPAWVDAVLERALQPNPHKRHAESSEFVFDLQQPTPQWLQGRIALPLIERNLSMFWKVVSLVLVVLAVAAAVA